MTAPTAPVDRAAEAVKGLSAEEVAAIRKRAVARCERRDDSCLCPVGASVRADCGYPMALQTSEDFARLLATIDRLATETAALRARCADAIEQNETNLATIDIAEARGREAGIVEGADGLRAYRAKQPPSREGIPDDNKQFNAGFLSGIETAEARLRTLLPATSDAKEVSQYGPPRDARCTCSMVRCAIIPEEHDDSCPVVAATHPASVETPGRAEDEDGGEAMIVSDLDDGEFTAADEIIEETFTNVHCDQCQQSYQLVEMDVLRRMIDKLSPTPPVDQPPGLDADDMLLLAMMEKDARDALAGKVFKTDRDGYLVEMADPVDASDRERTLAHYVLKLLARSRPELPEGWRDIATAPRDGRTIVDLWIPMDAPPHGYRIPNCVSGREVGSWFSQGEAVRRQPTHWMPLPAAPHPGTLMGEKKSGEANGDIRYLRGLVTKLATALASIETQPYCPDTDGLAEARDLGLLTDKPAGQGGKK